MERDSEIVKDAVLISQLYQCSVHISGDLFRLFEPLIGKKSIQYANGPDGRKRRQLMDRSFSHEAVKDYYDHFVKVSYIFALFAFCSTSADSFLKFFSAPLTEAIPTNWTAHYNTNTIYDTILTVMPLMMFSYLQYY